MAKAYAIKDPKGNILPWHTSFYAGNTKQDFMSNLSNIYKNHTWKDYYKMGYRCVPVEITEIKNEKV